MWDDEKQEFVKLAGLDQGVDAEILHRSKGLSSSEQFMRFVPPKRPRTRIIDSFLQAPGIRPQQYLSQGIPNRQTPVLRGPQPLLRLPNNELHPLVLRQLLLLRRRHPRHVGRRHHHGRAADSTGAFPLLTIDFAYPTPDFRTSAISSRPCTAPMSARCCGSFRRTTQVAIMRGERKRFPRICWYLATSWKSPRTAASCIATRFYSREIAS